MEPWEATQEPAGYEPTEDLVGVETPIKTENEGIKMEVKHETEDEGYLYLGGAKDMVEAASECETAKRSRFGLVRPCSR